MTHGCLQVDIAEIIKWCTEQLSEGFRTKHVCLNKEVLETASDEQFLTFFLVNGYNVAYTSESCIHFLDVK